MISYIGFKIEVPRRTIPQYYYRAYIVIKILERIGYKNHDSLNGNLSCNTIYLTAVYYDTYKHISNNYHNNESYILTSGLGSQSPFNTIRCVLSNSVYNTNFNNNNLYSKVLVLNATNVLNIHKLLL